MGTAWHTFRRDLFGMVSPDSKGARCGKSQLCHLGRFQHRIRGLDNPTRQFLPIMSTKCCSGDGEGRKDKGGGGGSRGKTKLCVTKLYVKDGAWKGKMVCDKVVCERWCVWKFCVKESVWQSCVWKMVCDKAVCERWCGERWCVTKLCVKDGVWQSCVWNMVYQRWCVKDGACERWMWQSCVRNMVCERWCVTKLCVKDGVSKMVGDKVVCERWCVKECVKDGVDKSGPSAPPEPAQCHKCHACHAKRWWMWPSAMPATQNDGGCHQVPRLPCKVPRSHRRPKPKHAARASPVP